MRYLKFSLIPISILLYVNIFLVAGAQVETRWSNPENLSETVLNEAGQPAPTMSPVLVTDQWGNIHAIFPAMIGTGENAPFDTLFYAMFDGSQWTQPNDVLFRESGNFWLPQMTVDSDGWLHLVWIDGPRAMYSRAPVHAAGIANSWSEPTRISNDAVRNASIFAGGDGSIHVVYCSSEEADNLAHIKTENGYDWSRPVEITTTGGCWTMAAKDGNGRLHVVFSEQPGVGAGSAVYYSRSVDGGLSWTAPLEIDSKDERYLANYGPSWINVATVGLDEIHIIWDGNPAGQRWHQMSVDGGESWSEPYQIVSDHRGLTGPNTLIVDGSGTVHMVSLGWLDTEDNPKGPFHASWRDDDWTAMELIGERSDWDAEGGSAAILGGNLLVAGWRHQTGEGNEVWVSKMTIDSPFIPPAKMPTPSPSINLPESSVPAEIAMESPTAESTDISFAGDQPPSSRSSSYSIYVASILVVFILGIIIFVRLKGRTRRF